MMKLKSLTVSKLFDRLDYSLYLDQDIITIITGPNGYGKTILLKIINNFMTKNLQFFFQIKFEYIEIEFADYTLKLEVIDNILYIEKTYLIINKIESFTYQNDSIKNSEFLVGFELEDGQLIKKNYLKSKYKNKFFLKESNDTDIYSSKALEWLDEVIGKTEITFIKAQRLETLNENSDMGMSTELTIKKFSKDLSRKIRKASEVSSSIAQRLDSTFPRRLFEFSHVDSSPEFIKDRLLGLQDTRSNFIKYGLLEFDEENDSLIFRKNSIEKAYTNVLNLYIEDALEKLSAYDELYSKVELFVSLLNEKMLAFKNIKINQERGFYFVSDFGDEIELENLSSGEQNQIVLFYDMIFNTKENSIVLIDEPEISLHVAWQKEFLDSLQKILKVNHIDKVIIATHSPQVINGKWGLTIDLFKIINGESK
ncbi:TPA: AAA family ATPase [Yersinia enterocolitica]|nr:AAA family ATPase [Yersinia thracica]EKN4025843.1 AAA family ATPase [Yersinia enterocolitica]EKN5996047.1 ATPase [Yersinia enterocolitica]HEN3247016.1 AAA family ATPase [Yersinia enterocolitica]HEN3291345.1 AAA family ATPase [Yersinia enterocolitica]